MKRVTAAEVDRVADIFAAMGSVPRVQILRLLLSAHPDGLIVGDIQSELKIPNSTLSHHLEKLKMQGLVEVRRDRQFLWYTANTKTLRNLLSFLFAECCSRNHVIEAEEVVQICR
jgi:ArsR family transcriptional regulator